MSESNEEKIPQFQLKEDGDVVFNKKGQSTLLAKYDEERGLLIFESFEIDQKYRAQIIRAITEDAMTGEQTGKTVKGYRIAGRPKDIVKKNEPPQPRKSPVLGDKTPEFVKWLFKWRPQAAYARYGVLLDSNDEPRTAHCRRVERGLLLPDTGKAMEIGAEGKDVLGLTEIDREDGILALRATCMTFTTKEIVRGEGDEESPFDTEEDQEPADEDGGEAADDGEKKAAKGKRGAKTAAEQEDADDDKDEA